MNLGSAILIVRRRLGLSQKEVAYKCGVSQTSMSQIETGTKRPKEETLLNFSKETGTPLVALYLLATTQLGVPQHLRCKYDLLYPMLEEMIFTQLVEDGTQYLTSTMVTRREALPIAASRLADETVAR